MYACESGNLDIAKALVNASANLELKETSKGYTALIKASMQNLTDMVNVLLTAGAKVNYTDSVSVGVLVAIVLDYVLAWKHTFHWFVFTLRDLWVLLGSVYISDSRWICLGI